MDDNPIYATEAAVPSTTKGLGKAYERNDVASRRKRRRRRITKIVRRVVTWSAIIGLAYWIWSDPVRLQMFFQALSFGTRLLFAMMFMIVQFGAIFWFMGRTKTEIIRPGDPKNLTFEDYKGQDRLVEMVRQWLSLLYDRTDFQKMGGRFINGLLLYGPPGTGKTLLAKCMAGEAGVAFMSVEGSGFRGMFFGMDVLKMMGFIRKARKLAREYGACIAFIDEIDAVGASRGGVMGGQQAMGMRGGLMGMGAGSGALTRLLYEMDGVEEKTRTERWKARIFKLFRKTPPPRDWHVLFMGSTNRPDVLDAALTRPGRFDRTIEVSAPDKTGRREIVMYYLDQIASDDTVDIEAIVQDTAWATPAKIMAALTKDAVRLALFDGRDKVSQRDIDQAFQEQAFGLEKPIEEMQGDQRQQIAYHEAGHAIAFHHFRPEHRIVRATIIGRGGGTLGYVQPVPKYEEYVMPLRVLVADIMVSLAGHVATKVFLGEYWTGAYSDFDKVRARIMHLAALGYFGPPVKAPGAMIGQGEFAGREREVELFWKQLEDQCERFIRHHAREVNAVAQALLEKESLTGDEVVEIVKMVNRSEEDDDTLELDSGERRALSDETAPEIELEAPVGVAEEVIEFASSAAEAELAEAVSAPVEEEKEEED
jgi:cell division protease FtsH